MKQPHLPPLRGAPDLPQPPVPPLLAGVPLLLFLLIGGTNRNAHLDGISFPLYYMTGMAAWGTMMAVISSGARIAAERQVGWTRQLRITPLPRAPTSGRRSSAAT